VSSQGSEISKAFAIQQTRRSKQKGYRDRACIYARRWDVEPRKALNGDSSRNDLISMANQPNQFLTKFFMLQFCTLVSTCDLLSFYKFFNPMTSCPPCIDRFSFCVSCSPTFMGYPLIVILLAKFFRRPVQNGQSCRL
jgi:hypothetical protein